MMIMFDDVDDDCGDDGDDDDDNDDDDEDSWRWRWRFLMMTMTMKIRDDDDDVCYIIIIVFLLVTAITQQFYYHPSMINTGIWLYRKSSQSSSSWVKRFVILRGSFMFLFHSPHNNKPIATSKLALFVWIFGGWYDRSVIHKLYTLNMHVYSVYVWHVCLYVYVCILVCIWQYLLAWSCIYNHISICMHI